MIETSQLMTFVAVARWQSFSRAAAEMGVTQSAISQSVKNLEKKIDATLFQRSGKQVYLTEQGKKLFDFSQTYLQKLEDTLVEVGDSKSNIKGKLRVGTLYGLGKSYLGNEFIQFKKIFPDISLHVHLDFPEILIKKFERFELDALIVPEFCLPRNSIKSVIGEEYVSLVTPRVGPYILEAPVAYETMVDVPVILYEEQDGLFNYWMSSVYGRTPKNLHKSLVINSHGAMIRAVAEGLGVSVLPTHVIERSQLKDQLNILDGPYKLLNSSLCFAYQPELSEVRRLQVLEKYFENRNFGVQADDSITTSP